MPTARDWARFLAVAAGYAVAFFLFWRAMPSSVDSPWFVLTAMVCFLGLAFVARPLVRIRMPRPLRRIRRWEAQGRVYRVLRVPGFGSLLRRTPLRRLNADVYLGGGARSSGELNAQLEAAEASHFWAGLLVVPYMLRLCLLGRWSDLCWIAVAQVLVNAYPVMHLRVARHRLERLASRTSRHLRKEAHR